MSGGFIATRPSQLGCMLHEHTQRAADSGREQCGKSLVVKDRRAFLACEAADRGTDWAKREESIARNGAACEARTAAQPSIGDCVARSKELRPSRAEAPCENHRGHQPPSLATRLSRRPRMAPIEPPHSPRSHQNNPIRSLAPSCTAASLLRCNLLHFCTSALLHLCSLKPWTPFRTLLHSLFHSGLSFSSFNSVVIRRQLHCRIHSTQGQSNARHLGSPLDLH